MKHYVEKIIMSYEHTKEEKSWSFHQVILLCFFDSCKAQCTTSLLQTLDNNKINILLILSNCTHRLQPLDISLNKAANEFLRAKFQQSYAQEVCFQFQGGKRALIDLWISVLKPLRLQWIISWNINPRLFRMVLRTWKSIWTNNSNQIASLLYVNHSKKAMWLCI